MSDRKQEMLMLLAVADVQQHHAEQHAAEPREPQLQSLNVHHEALAVRRAERKNPSIGSNASAIQVMPHCVGQAAYRVSFFMYLKIRAQITIMMSSFSDFLEAVRLRYSERIPARGHMPAVYLVTLASPSPGSLGLAVSLGQSTSR
jgi:hypothetical protein